MTAGAGGSHALDDGDLAVRQGRRAVERGRAGEPAELAGPADGGAGHIAGLVQRAVLDAAAGGSIRVGARSCVRRRHEPRAASGVPRLAQQSTRGGQFGIAGRHVGDQHLGGAAADHLVAARDVRAAEVEALAAGAPLRERLRGGPHHGVLQQAAADGAGDGRVLAHQHLRSGRARRGALVGDQRDQGERAPGLQFGDDVVDDLVHLGSIVQARTRAARQVAAGRPSDGDRPGIVKARPPPYDFEKGSSFVHPIPPAASGPARVRARAPRRPT